MAGGLNRWRPAGAQDATRVVPIDRGAGAGSKAPRQPARRRQGDPRRQLWAQWTRRGGDPRHGEDNLQGAARPCPRASRGPT